MAQSKELIYPWKLVIFNSYVTNYQRVNQQLMGRQGLQGIESLKLRLSLGIGDQFGHKVMGKISGKCGENVGKMWGKCGENVGEMWGKCGENMGKIWISELWEAIEKKWVSTPWRALDPFVAMVIYGYPMRFSLTPTPVVVDVPMIQ